MYKLRVFDKDGKLISLINTSHQYKIHKVFNEANEIDFLLPANEENKKYMNMAQHFEIWNGDNREIAGKIAKRNLSSNPYNFTGLSNEIYLAESLLPENTSIDSNVGSSILGAGTKLKDVAEQLTYKYETSRINRDFELSSSFSDGNISFELENSTALAFITTGQTEEIEGGINAEIFIYPVITSGQTSGRISFEFSIPAGFDSHRLRWQQQVAETNNIIYRTRFSVDGGVSWGSYSGWADGNWTQDTPENEGLPIVNVAGETDIEVQFQLLNEDGGSTAEPITRTEGFDGAGNDIVIYGSTPILESVEVIFREKAENRVIFPHPVYWPVIDTPLLYGVEFNYKKALRALNEICNKNGYEFYVDEDKYLHLSSEFGTDKSNETILSQGKNMNIFQAQDDSKNQSNYLICLGAGSGLNQIQTIVKNSEHITNNGLMPDTVEFKDIETISELVTKGEEELSKRLNPKTKFKIQGVIDEINFDLGDTIGISIPNEDIYTTGRIIEVELDGKSIRLGINDKLDNIIDQIVDDPSQFPGEETQNPTGPRNLTGIYGYQKAIIRWKAEGYGKVYKSISSTVGSSKLIGTGNGLYIDEPLVTGSTYYYWVSQVIDGIDSQKSGPIRVTIGKIDSGELISPVPGKPQWADTNSISTNSRVTTQNQRVFRIFLAWKVVIGASKIKIERQETVTGEWEYSVIVGGGITKFTDAVDLANNTQYSYKLTAYNELNDASIVSDVISITTGSNPVPTISATAPTISPGFKMIGVSFLGVPSDFDRATLSYYVVQYQSCTASEIMDGTISTGDYEMPLTPAWSSWTDIADGKVDGDVFIHSDLDYSKGYRYRYQAVNNSNNESGWSNPSSGTIPAKTGQNDITYKSITTEKINSINADITNITAGAGSVVINPNGITISGSSAANQENVSTAETNAKAYTDDEIIILDETLSYNITTLGNDIDDFSSDSKITRAEANSLEQRLNEVQAEDDDLISVSTTLGVSSSTYTTAMSALDTYLSGYINQTSYPINITDRNIMQTKFEDVQNEKSKLINAITAQRETNAKAYANPTKPEGAHLFHFDRSVISTDGTEPEDGAVYTLRPNEGKFSGAVAVEESTENLMVTEGAGLNLTTWQIGLASVTQEGEWYRIEQTGVGYAIRGNINETALVDGDTYTASIEVYNDNSSSVEIKIDWCDLATFYVIQPGEKRRITATGSKTYDSMQRFMDIELDVVGDTLLFRNPQVEHKSFTTSFVDGSRAGGELTYQKQFSQNDNFAIGIWAKAVRDDLVTDLFCDNTDRRNGQLRIDGSLKIELLVRDLSGVNRNLYATLPPGINLSQYNYYVLVSESGYGTRIYVNGQNIRNHSSAYPEYTQIDIGRNGMSSSSGGMYDELLILDYAPTPEQIQSWYNSQAPFYDNEPVISGGSIIMSSNGVKVQSKDSSTYIDANGITIRDSEGNTTISEDKISTNIIEANMYKEIRNVLPYNYLDSLDSSRPLECDFYIPTETVKIVNVKLSAKGLPFRAYAKGTAFRGTTWLSSGAHTHSITGSTSSDGQHTHSITGSTSSDGQHTHSVDTSSSNTGNDSGSTTSSYNDTSTEGSYGDVYGSHYHTFSYLAPADHSHSYNVASGTGIEYNHDHSISGSTDIEQDHTHSVSGSTAGPYDGMHDHDISHEHDLTFGIYEGTAPTGVNLYVDNGVGYGSAISLGDSTNLATELNISSYITGTGWKTIKFTSTQLGRINAQLILKVDLTA